jgi:site-specific recombinase XerD
MTQQVSILGNQDLPPILLGSATPHVSERVNSFYFSAADIFERWVERRSSPHTRRAYRQDVMTFVNHLGISWPKNATALFTVKVSDVQGWRDLLLAKGTAPKTMNRRVSSVSSFYKYLGNVAAEMRLPIIVPNPAHSQFIPRNSADPVDETQALTPGRARQILGMPDGESVLDYRDRAILKFFLFAGARLATGCTLHVADFHQDEGGATIKLHEKGDRRRKIGLHFAAAEAIADYIEKAELTSGPLFRPRLNSRSQKLADRAFSPNTLYLLLQRYLRRLPGALKERELPDGTKKLVCIYTPHSLRATVATLLLESGVDISSVRDLLGHRHVTTTQIYDKRRRGTAESASHQVPL